MCRKLPGMRKPTKTSTGLAAGPSGAVGNAGGQPWRDCSNGQQESCSGSQNGNSQCGWV